MKTTIVLLAALAATALAETGVKIIRITGEVKVRRGVEEAWEPAKIGMLLELIDSILTLEGEALLELDGGRGLFRLGNHSMMDIEDLRQITERELFVRLMSEKVSKISVPATKPQLRTADASSIHGTQYELAASDSVRSREQWRQREINAAQAMFAQELVPNVVLKLHKVLTKYPDVEDCGETQFYLGKAFETMNRPGQAIDAYQLSLEESSGVACQDQESQAHRAVAQQALKDLQE